MTRKALAMLAWMLASATLGAIMIDFGHTIVPFERVSQTLQRLIRERPKDVDLRINLARLHALAYADKSEQAKARVEAGWEKDAYPSVDVQVTKDFRSVTVKPAPSVEAAALAKAHLVAAIKFYGEALSIDSKNLVARLGKGWCQEQLGDRVDAIATFRELIRLAQSIKQPFGPVPPDPKYVIPVSVEAAGYLVLLLDASKDAAEIQRLQALVKRHAAQYQRPPMSPIVVPLVDAATPASLLADNARVLFDADGSGRAKPWTWITPRAAWLVFDHRGSGKIRSAFQWFGFVTFSMFWQDGYEALEVLDDNGDGVIDGPELRGFALWHDRNGNGVSDPGEVQPVGAWGIVRISTAHIETAETDTMVAWSSSGITFRDGHSRPTYDVMLQPR